MNLKDTVVLITGGGSGMGAATGHYLAAKGAKVALIDLDLKAAQSQAQSINALALEGNVCDPVAMEKVILKVIDQLGALHAVINCAGIAPAARIVGREGPMPLEAFNRVIEINLIGTFNVMRLAAAHMMNQPTLNEDGERGVIINTASVAAYEGQIGQAAYSASKGGIVSMTLPAAREFSKFGIRVVTIAPGVFATPMMAGMPEAVEESLVSNVPFPHRLGQAEEFAQLASQIIENRYLNGTVIRLDGALRMAPK